MKVLHRSVFILAALTLSAAVTAQQSSDRVVVPLTDASRPASLRLGLTNGSVSVRGVDRKDVLIETHPRAERVQDSDPDNGLKRLAQPIYFSVEEQNNRVEIDVSNSNRACDFVIEVPLKADLEISTINGGELKIDGVDGNHEISNVNGSIEMTRVGGSVVAHSTNGAIRVTLVRVEPQKPMAFTTLNGAVDVTLPATTKANLRLRSDRGELLTDFDLKMSPQSLAPSIEDTRKSGGRYRIDVNKSLNGTINGGGPEFELRSFNGRVTVRRQDAAKPQ